MSLLRNAIDSTQESACECGIEPPGSISHGVSYSHELILQKAVFSDPGGGGIFD